MKVNKNRVPFHEMTRMGKPLGDFQISVSECLLPLKT